MKIKWLIIGLTGVRSPTRAESGVLGWFWAFLGQFYQAAFVAGEPFCDMYVNLFLMKSERLITYVTQLPRPLSEQKVIFGWFLAFFGQFRLLLQWGSHFVILKPSLGP